MKYLLSLTAARWALVVFAGLLFSICVTPASAPAWAAGGYRIVDLGTLGGSHSQAMAINDHGQVVGYSINAHGLTHAFLWSRGRMTDLGALDGSYYSVAVDINNRGQVLGYTNTVDGLGHAVLWDRGQITDLGASCAAEAINDQGDVVGSCDNRPVLWSDGQRIDLTQRGLPPFSTARDINKAGELVGGYVTPTNGFHAYRWRDGTVTDLGSPPSDVSEAMAVNAHGQAAGRGNGPEGYMRAYFWSNRQMTDVGTLGGQYSQAAALNNRGEVVGQSGRADGRLHAFRWRYGVMTDLGVLYDGGMGGSTATDVNTRGLIVGSSAVSYSEAHAVLWVRSRP